MTPELREFVLSLPVELKRELAKIDGPCWFIHGRLGLTLTEKPDRDDPLEDYRTRTGVYRLAYLPVSPIAIAVHAATLSGRDGSHFVSVTACPCFRFDTSWAEIGGAQSPRDQGDVRVIYENETGVEKDPTGHRAAIELLRKVMSP